MTVLGGLIKGDAQPLPAAVVCFEEFFKFFVSGRLPHETSDGFMEDLRV
jgi:hypothetical protein